MILRISSFFLAAILTASALLCTVSVYAGEDKKTVEKKSDSVGLVDEDAYSEMAHFLTILAIVHNHYVDKDKVSWKNMFRAAIRGMMRELDPFSEYESPEDFQSLKEHFSGQHVGIGVVVSGGTRGVEILSVLPDAPAAKAGLRSGDIILSVDGNKTGRVNASTIAEQIRGEEGTPVKLEIYRPSKDSVMEFSVIRAKVTISSIQGVKIIPGSDGTGYCRIVQFGDATPAEFGKALEKLKKEGMTSLILDLRDNPGGTVSAVIPICNRFLPAGKMIVSVEGRDGKKKVVTSDSNGPKFLDLPMVILINGNSASASELLAACMKDHKRAVLVGEHSFGKGSVQTIIPLPADQADADGKKRSAALKLTTAKYYTPGRHQIHGKGIHPDIEVPLSRAQRNLFSMQLAAHPGEVSPRVYPVIRDTALERSLEILKGLRIFQHSVSENKVKK